MLEVRSEESARRLEEKLPPALRLHSVQEVARILKTAHEDLIMLGAPTVMRQPSLQRGFGRQRGPEAAWPSGLQHGRLRSGRQLAPGALPQVLL